MSTLATSSTFSTRRIALTGLSGFSANDWLAPTVTWVVLGVYGVFRPPEESRRFEQARAAATVIAFAVNVLTI